MRTLTLSLVLALAFLGACGKKKAPASPTNTSDTAAPGGGASESADPNREKDMTSPEAGDESSAKSSDPCEGGE